MPIDTGFASNISNWDDFYTIGALSSLALDRWPAALAPISN
jgi:hypothetical protein